MNLPEQELFSVEDIAARWQKSVTYVQDLIRRGLLPMGRMFIKTIPGTIPGKPRLKMKSFVQRKDLEEFERTREATPKFLTKQEKATQLRCTVRTVERGLKNGTIRGARGPNGRWQISP